MTPWHIIAYVFAAPVVFFGLVGTVGALRDAWERYRIGRDIERMLEAEADDILQEQAFNEHLMATEWVLREVFDEVEARGWFSWEEQP